MGKIIMGLIMASRLPNLIWLRTFEAAARHLNFTKAGQELGLTQTAVSLHIKALEGTLQCRLFDRNPRHLQLTDMGQAYAVAVRKGIGDLHLSTVSLFGTAARQTVTVRAQISTVTLWLAPRLPAFLAAHPNINIRLVSTIWATSISDDDVDVDLRIGLADSFEAGAEQISTETIVPIAASSEAASIQRTADLLRGPLIQILGYDDSWENYLSAFGLKGTETGVRLSVDTTAAALALVAGSGGYAVVMTRFARQAIASGSSIAIVGKPIAFPVSHYLVATEPGRRPRPEVELFKDWLRAALQEDPGSP